MTGKLNLDVVPLYESGPGYAIDTNNNTQLTITHNHDGIDTGASINIAGQVVLNDLSISNYQLTNVEALTLEKLTNSLTGINDLNQLTDINGNLFFTDGYGVLIQITNNGQPVGPIDSLLSFLPLSITANRVLAPTDHYNLINVDTTGGAVTVTLPIAASVPSGRFYHIVDVAENAGIANIIIKVAVGSGNTIQTAYGNYDTATAAKLVTGGASCLVYTDGVSKWFVLEDQKYTYTNQTVGFSGTSILTIYGGSTLDLTSGAHLIIESGASVAMQGNSTLAFTGTSSITMATGTSIAMNNGSAINLVTGSSIAMASGSTISPALGAAFEANYFGNIQGNALGSIASTVPGGIILAGGATDWVTFSSPRTLSRAYPLIPLNTAGAQPDGSWWKWYDAVGSANVLALKSVFANNVTEISVAIPTVHNGATLASVTIQFFVGDPHVAGIPGTMPSISVKRARITTQSGVTLSGTDPQFFPNPASGFAWFDGGNTQSLTYEIGRAHV